MLLCSSKIPVSENFTPSVLVNLAIEWVTNSRNYNIEPFSWDGSSEFMKTGKNGELFQVVIFESEKTCAIHFVSTDNRLIKWTTDFILDIENNVLAFQLYREAPADIPFVHKAFSLPTLVKKIIELGYTNLDNGIETKSCPILIADEDVDFVSNIILRKTTFALPVVYISCEKEGHCIINPYMLAEKLNGVAHVLYEISRSVSFRLKEKTNGKNPYSGAIEVFYPKGNRKFLPSQLTGTHSNKVYTIVNSVFEHLNQLRVEDRFSWSQLQANKLRKQLYITIQSKEQNSKDYHEFEQMYEELLAEKESQIKRLSDQLSSANHSIGQLEAQLTAVKNIPVLILGEEQDLYPYEQQSILVEVLEKELRSAKSNSRRAHIFLSLISANKCDDAVNKKRQKVKACLHGYTKMTKIISKEMKDIGFELSDEGKHIKVIFGEDKRYRGTLSKTGSDHRSGDNIAHDLISSIF